MKTENLILHTDWIKSDSLRTWWYKNGQMGCYQERKDGKRHGEYKRWYSNGQMRRHYF